MSTVSTLLILDDNPRSLEMLSAALEHDALRILTASRPEDALALVRTQRPDLLLTDLVMPGMNGLEVLDRVMAIAPQTEVVLMTAHYTTETAVAAIRQGAADYLEKPVKLSFLRERVARLVAAARVRREVLSGHAEADAAQFEGIVARSPRMWELFSRMRRIGPHFRSVLVEGETGTGKELVAGALHRLSGRNGPYVVVNCSAITETLFESELFGHVRGAFTGADRDKMGLFEHASGGTLFLDEIGDLPLTAQGKLLRALQNQEVLRVGSLVPRKVDVRVVAATNRDVRAGIREGSFREDLYYRLSMASFKLPALRERAEDIPLLVRHFIEEFRREHESSVQDISHRALVILERHPWPGNVRELENAVGHASMMARRSTLEVEDLPESVRMAASKLRDPQSTLYDGLTQEASATAAKTGVESSLAENERKLIAEAVREAGGNQSKAARRLGIGRDALRYKLKRHGLI